MTTPSHAARNSTLASLFLHVSLFIAAISVPGFRALMNHETSAPSGRMGLLVEMSRSEPKFAHVQPKIRARHQTGLEALPKEHAKAEAAPPQSERATGMGGAGGTGTSVTARATARDLYLDALRQEIERLKDYPVAAKAMGQTGNVEVQFVVSREGEISEITLVHGTPFERLNEAALQLIHDLHHFKPIPTELNLAQWKIRLTINYELN